MRIAYKVIIFLMLACILVLVADAYRYGGKTAVKWASQYYDLKFKYDAEVEYHNRLYVKQRRLEACMKQFEELVPSVRQTWTVAQYCEER